MAALPRPPRAPDARAPGDFERWQRDLQDYLNRVYNDLVSAATEAAGAQPLSAKLTAIDALSDAGLMEQTGASTYATRAIGVAAGSSIPTRDDADTRYEAAGSIADHEADADPHTQYVKGPDAGSTDNAVARYDGASGKWVQDSDVTIDDNGVLAGFRIGTFTGAADAASTGYITITDAGGTSRRLMVRA